MVKEIFTLILTIYAIGFMHMLSTKHDHSWSLKDQRCGYFSLYVQMSLRAVSTAQAKPIRTRSLSVEAEGPFANNSNFDSFERP
jgi:hypothetical protein